MQSVELRHSHTLSILQQEGGRLDNPIVGIHIHVVSQVRITWMDEDAMSYYGDDDDDENFSNPM